MPKVLAVDLDGTLFYPRGIKHCISKKNRHFLQRFIDDGNKLVLVTSRTLGFIEKLKKEINRPFDAVACCGAQIMIDGQIIKNQTLENVKAQNFIKEINEKYHPLCVIVNTKRWPIILSCSKKLPFFLMAFYKTFYFFQLCYRERYTINSILFQKELYNGDLYKINIFFGFGKNKNIICKDLNKRLREEYQDFEPSWVGPIIEITPKNCNKGYGLKEYIEYNHFNPHDVYVVGDSGNDIAMFNSYYENSYCMMHAYPSVKKYAHYQISYVYNLEKVLKGEKNGKY